MTKPRKNHWFFNLWIKIRGLIALAIIMAGVLVAVVSLLLPFDALYKQQLENFLRTQWQLELSIEKVDGEWQGYGPRFHLQNLLISGEQSMQIDSLDLKLNVFQLLIPGGKSGIELNVEKADLAFVHSDKGAGLALNQNQQSFELSRTIESLLNTGSLRVDELILNLYDQQGGLIVADLRAKLLIEQDDKRRGLRLDINDGALLIKAVTDKNRALIEDANWYFSLSKFDLAELNPFLVQSKLPSMLVDGEAWFVMKAGDLINTTALIDWGSKQAELSGKLTLAYQAEQQNRYGQIKLTNIKRKNEALKDVVVNLKRNTNNINFFSQEIDFKVIDTLYSLVFKGGSLYGLEGRLNNLYLSYHRQQRRWQEITADIEQLSVNSPELSITALNGNLELHQQQLNLSIAGNQGALKLPKLFRGSAQWQQLLAQLQIPINNLQQINLQQLWLESEHYILDAQLQWFAGLEKQADYLSMQARTWEVDVTQLSNFWPYLVWDKKIVDWLDNGLRKGVVERGYLFHQGQMVEDAYEHDMANFFSRAYIREATVNFHTDWPPVKQLEAVAEFNEKAFSVQVDQAKSRQLTFNQAQVGMQSYKQDHLELKISAKSRANALLEYLRKSPIMQQVELNQTIALDGRQTVKLTIDIPLVENLQMRPQGTIKLHNSGLNSPHLKLKKLNGTVKVDNYDLLFKKITGELLDTPIMLNGKIEGQDSSGLGLQLSINGDFSAQKLFSELASNLPADGSSTWRFDLRGEQDRLHLNMYSDLHGTAINLPAPLAKTMAKTQPISINCEIPCEQSIVSINYDQQLQAVLQTGATPKLYELWLGEPSVLEPQKDANKLGGQIKHLDLDGWLALFRQHKGQTADGKTTTKREISPLLPSSNFSITVDQIQFMGRHFQQLELDFKTTENGSQISINSPSIKGSISIAKDLDSSGIVADFEYLHWKDAEVEQTQELTEKFESLPDLHVFVKKFTYNQIDLGALRLEMRNVAHGLHIEQLSLQSKVGGIQAVGNWYKNKGDDSNQLGQSAFDIIITAESIAEFLKPMGFNAPLSDAQTLVKIKAMWNGLPSRFDLKQLTGTLDIKIGEGEVLDAEPGFGRVLGLFSLTNLPRRLLFDFRDVMGEGLHFSNMEGHFTLDKGIATTDDFLVKASSANIKLTGKTNFILQNYDQTIMIQPQIGKTFPTIGAIAGGAVGAAAGFLVQGLLDKQLKLKNQIIYRVTGSWEEPQIEVIDND